MAFAIPHGLGFLRANMKSLRVIQSGASFSVSDKRCQCCILCDTFCFLLVYVDIIYLMTRNCEHGVAPHQTLSSLSPFVEGTVPTWIFILYSWLLSLVTMQFSYYSRFLFFLEFVALAVTRNDSSVTQQHGEPTDTAPTALATM